MSFQNRTRSDTHSVSFILTMRECILAMCRSMAVPVQSQGEEPAVEVRASVYSYNVSLTVYCMLCSSRVTDALRQTAHSEDQRLYNPLLISNVMLCSLAVKHSALQIC